MASATAEIRATVEPPTMIRNFFIGESALGSASQSERRGLTRSRIDHWKTETLPTRWHVSLIWRRRSARWCRHCLTASPAESSRSWCLMRVRVRLPDTAPVERVWPPALHSSDAP
jgi:hypothetical protein